MKRLFDFLIALLLILILCVPLIFLALAIKCKLGGPVFFTQVRCGRYGRPFKLIKFRTMTNACGLGGELLSDEHRMTPFGRRLRASSLDELPELWNILCGQMSLVGPRPLLMEYLPLYSPTQARRHEVRPGLTGWAQVNGRNKISWEEKFMLDVWYVDNCNMILDMKIILLTIRKVLSRDDISMPGEVTTQKFKGNNILKS